MTGLLASAQETIFSHSSESRRKFYTLQSYRKILCVFPKHSRSCGTLHHAYPLMRNVRAFVPPQGLLIVAAYLPQVWDVRFVDENVRSTTRSEWADVAHHRIQFTQECTIGEESASFYSQKFCR